MPEGELEKRERGHEEEEGLSRRIRRRRISLTSIRRIGRRG